MSHTFSTGQNVMYNSNCCTIFKTRLVDSAPAYLVREIESGTTHDNVLESALTSCTVAHVINTKWTDFTYNGDNAVASQWVFDNIIKNIATATQLSWGSNSDNSVYTFSASGETWTKNRS